jgi:hypothetical protein
VTPATRQKLSAGWIVVLAVAGLAAQDLRLPNAAGSVKFGVIGDSGTGDRAQYEVADLMLKFHGVFAFDRVIMLGDNVYGSHSPSGMEQKFARPYKKLIDAGVNFYASLGNHDDPSDVRYAPFNMGGERYYTFATKHVRFFALDSNQLDQKQIDWLEKQLKDAKEAWKICFFHHPLYSDAGTHGSSVNLRVVLEPIFLKYGVNAVFSGHDHVYERLKPQKGIYYFLSGSAGQLRKGDLGSNTYADEAIGYDRDCTFMIVEVSPTSMAFEVVSRTGQVVDSGQLPLQPKNPAGGGR